MEEFRLDVEQEARSSWSNPCWPSRNIVIRSADPMPTELLCGDEESDKDMRGLADSSSDNDAYVHAQPDELEEIAQVGDAQSAQCSTL